MYKNALITEKFIQKAKKIHGNKFDYTKVNYTNSYTKVKIYCKKCKEYFWQTPAGHLAGRGCNKCAIKSRAKKLRQPIDEFIERAKEIHGNKYSYDKVKYKNKETKVKIFCNTCKEYFWQTPGMHLRGSGCKKCGIKYQSFNHRLTQAEFLLKASKVHGNKYDYSQTIYTTRHSKIKIYCKKCKKYFEQEANSHLYGSGCPYCNFSKGETAIKEYLDTNSIKYFCQYRFKDCRDKHPLPFDFYLPDYNLCIEFQGEQHYNLNKYLFRSKNKETAELAFKILQLHDKIKKDYCLSHNINFLEIKYDENIQEILNNIF